MFRSNNLPNSIQEWVGREDFLHNLTLDWENPKICVTGIIGFGGEGKSAIARNWLNAFFEKNREKNKHYEINPSRENTFNKDKLKGIFWYSFSSGKSIDDFFEEALTFFVPENIEEFKHITSDLKIQILLSFLREQTYLIVLDGIEVCQHTQGGWFCLFKNKDLSKFLRDFAQGLHQSFCIISSRLPILDLVDFSSYTQRILGSLTYEESISLLEKLGVKGGREQFKKIIQFWKGYALGINITGSYFALKDTGKSDQLFEEDYFSKENNYLSENGGIYEKLSGIFVQYQSMFTDSQRQILYILAAMREPAKRDTLENFVHFSEEDLQQLLNLKVIDYHYSQGFTLHPLIRSHYSGLLLENQAKSQEIHKEIVEYYEYLLKGNIPRQPTLKQLFPAIECVHHSCLAGDFEKANKVRASLVNQGDAYVLSHQLGAYERALLVASDFFPDGDTYKEPLVKSFSDQAELISEVGFYLMCLGRLKEAVTFFERHKLIATEKKDLEQISISCINLSELYAHTGQLDYCLDAAQKAIEATQELNDEKLQRTAFARKGWALHLRHGEGEKEFKEAERLERRIRPDRRFLYSLRGIQHADHLCRVQRLDEAQAITETNLAICEENAWLDHVSQCHRVLSNVFLIKNKDEGGYRHIIDSLKTAHLNSRKDTLISALSTRGRWYVHLQRYDEAFQDLNEALSLAQASDYLILEISIRIALSLAHTASKDFKLAEQELKFSKHLSNKVGYFWGVRDAKEAFHLLETARSH